MGARRLPQCRPRKGFVLSDAVMMPTFDGLGLVRGLRENPANAQGLTVIRCRRAPGRSFAGRPAAARKTTCCQSVSRRRSYGDRVRTHLTMAPEHAMSWSRNSRKANEDLRASTTGFVTRLASGRCGRWRICGHSRGNMLLN